MNQSFHTAITGTKSFQYAIDTTASDIANINTDGYKGNVTEFKTLFSKHLGKAAKTTSDDLGYGVGVATNSIDLKQGAKKTTENTFDLSINKNGWFGVIKSNVFDARKTGYTRNGAFSRDINSNLVDQQGRYLLGTNYNNIKKTGSSFEFIPNVTPTKESHLKQSNLLVPKDLFFPTVATKNISLNMNLSGDKKAFFASFSDINLASLYNENKAPISIKPNQTLILALTKGDFSYKNGLNLSVNINGVNEAKTINLSVNNKNISLDLSPQMSKEEVAQKISTELNKQGIQSKVTNGNKLTITDKTAIEIKSDESLIKNAQAKILSFGADFSNLQELKDAFNKELAKQSLNSSFILDEKSRLKLLAKDDLSVNIQATDNSSQDLLEILNGLNKNYTTNSVGQSTAFLAMGRSINTQIVSNDNKSYELKLDFRKNDKTIDEQEDWILKGKIYTNKALEPNMDLANIINQTKPIDLQEKSSLWLKTGSADLVSTNSGYFYKLSPQKIPSTASSQKFSAIINGENIELNLTPMSKQDVSNAILNALNQKNIKATQDNNGDILIAPKNDELSVKNNGSNLIGMSIKDTKLVRLEYGKDFKTAQDLTNKLNQNFQTLDFKLENSKFIASLKGTKEESFDILGSNYSNDEFLQVLSGLKGTIGKNAPKETSAINAQDVLNTDQKNLSFNIKNGSLIGDTSFKFLKTSQDLNLNLKSAISSSSNTSSNDYINQDGVLQGSLLGYNVEKSGEIMASFSNGVSRGVGMVSVFHFINPSGLERMGENLFKASNNSGEAVFFYDKTGQIIKDYSIDSRTLEASNVALSGALTNLIIHQRAFQGTAKVITTSDQMIEKAIGLKR